MKKLLVLVMMSLVISLFMAVDSHANSAPLDTGDEAYTSSYSKTLNTDIIPNVQLIDPGSIRVTISWSVLSLSFEKRLHKDANGNDVRFYMLKSPQSLVFNIENKSISGSSFNGTIYVIPQFSRTPDQEMQSSNIKLSMLERGKVHTVQKDGSDKSIVLNYSNVEDLYIEWDRPEKLLKGTATEQEIRNIMTTNVTFIITTTNN